MPATVRRDRLSPVGFVLRATLLGVFAALPVVALALPVTDRRPVEAGAELRLRMEAGRLVVRPGTEPAIVIEADLPPGMALRWRELKGGWVLVVDDRERLLPREARLTLSVPAALALRIDAGDAEVDLDGVGGAGLVLRAGRSPVRIASSSSAPIQAEAMGGDLRLELAQPGRVRAATLGGRLTLRAATLAEGDIRLETLSGDLELRVPAGGPATVRPRLAGGLLALPEAAQATPDGRVQLGAGAGRIELVSLSGDAAVVEDPGLAPAPAAPSDAPPGTPDAPPPPAG